MKNTVALISTNRGIFDKTQTCLDLLSAEGLPNVLVQKGSPCVALARNLALHSACEYLRAHEETDTVLMIDDDMLFSPNEAHAVTDRARLTGVATSAMYATLLTTIAGVRMGKDKSGEDRWLTGLGFIAIPRELLLWLESQSELFHYYKQPFREFTWACADSGVWMAEDLRLTQRLGGVHLLPVVVGHLKTIPIYPDPLMVELIKNGEKLGAEKELSQLDHVSAADLQDPLFNQNKTAAE